MARSDDVSDGPEHRADTGGHRDDGGRHGADADADGIDLPDEHEVNAHGIDLPDEHEVNAEGVDALMVPVELVENELRKKSKARRALELTASVGMVVLIFAFAFPAISNSPYSAIGDQLTKLSWAQVAGLTALWALVMWTYTGVLVNSMPGLRRTQALVLNFAGSAVSNVVPFGGAVGVGSTYAISMSWGFPPPAVTLSILVSGIWNVFAKLALPIAALVVLAATGEATRSLVVPAVVGLVALAGGITAFALILSSEDLAARIGSTAQRLANRVLRLIRRHPVEGWSDAVVDFRHRSRRLIRERWSRLTIWMALFQLGQFALLLFCVRAMGAETTQLGWIEVFAAYAFGSLLTTIPLTPSGVGFVEAGVTAALIAFGGADAGSAAAVLLYRGFTYLAEIPFGALAWGVWGMRHSWRQPIGSRT